MPKIKAKATELQNVDVGYISLVSVPANQIPFRITKSADKTKGTNNMIDLGSMFTKSKAPEAQPQVLGVLIGEGVENPEDILKQAGFPVEFQEAGEDGTTLYKSSDIEMPEEVVAVVAAKGVTVLVDQISKEFRPWSMEGDLEEQANAASFYPLMYTALDVAEDKAHDILHSSAEPGEAAAKIKGLFIELADYMESAASNIPSMAFKIAKYSNVEDKELNGDDKKMGTSETTDVDPEEPGEPEGGGESAESTETVDGGTTTEAETETPAETDPSVTPVAPEGDETSSEGEGTAGDFEGDDGDSEASFEKSAETTALTAIMQKLDGMGTQMELLTSEVEGIKKSVDDVREEADKAAEQVATLKNSVSYPDDEDPKQTPVKKSDSDIWAGSALDNIAR